MPPGRGNDISVTGSALRHASCPHCRARRVIQSWDTASKGGPENDWSVCTTWLFQDRLYYLFARRSGGATTTQSSKSAPRRWLKHYNPTKLLIEDTGTGFGPCPGASTA